MTNWLSGFAATYRFAHSMRLPSTSISRVLANGTPTWPLRVGTHGLPSTSKVGSTGSNRLGETSAIPEPSATGVVIFIATHSPVSLDMAKA